MLFAGVSWHDLAMICEAANKASQQEEWPQFFLPAHKLQLLRQNTHANITLSEPAHRLDNLGINLNTLGKA